MLQSLLTAIDQGRMPHACFFCCADEGMAELAAKTCAARFCGIDADDLANYPDFFDLDCPVPADDLRALLEECARRTFTEGSRCVRFTRAHLLSELGQNLLLKTLEEPPPRTLFLLCGNRAAMLPTIRSRCTAVRIPAPTPEELRDILMAEGVAAPAAAAYAPLAGSLLQARRLCAEEDYRALRQSAMQAFGVLLGGTPPYTLTRKGQHDKNELGEIAGFWLGFARDMLALQNGLPAQSADLAPELTVLARRFTSGRINCMIEMLTATLARLRSNASAGATLDSLMTQILEKVV